MKRNNIKYLFAAAVLGLGLTSCEDFLNKPTEDSYVAGGYYKTDDQCISAVNYLYNSPWYDFQRGFFKVGEVLAGNYYWSGSPYQNFSLNGNDEDLRNMSYSLWAVNGHANIVRNYIAGGGASDEVKKQTMGECLLWKAMAYFYLVRTFGAVPIVHDNSGMIEAGSYNSQMRVRKEDVYEYIIMTLEKAIEWLPYSCAEGRLDKFCAKGLLAKVYLTKAGVTGTLNKDDLQKACYYAEDLLDPQICGRSLEPNYADIFKLEGNKSKENLIAWRWVVSSQWTSQNTFQSDLGMTGIDEFGDVWGEWGCPSVDLQDAFGFDLLSDPQTRPDVDTRRKATLMTAGDVIPYLWRDKGGFDYLRFEFDKDYNPSAWGEHRAGTGCNVVKHLYGNNADHVAVLGTSAARMASSLCTPILRLADVYLVYAEAKTLLGQVDQKALDAYNKVHQRAIPRAIEAKTLTFDMIWKERRLELACEGDRWYDFVRLAYYKPQQAINEIKGQRRSIWWEVKWAMKNYYDTGMWSTKVSDDAGNPVEMKYDEEEQHPNVTEASFTIPFPMEDLTFNPHLSEDPVAVDVRKEFSY